MTDDKVYGELCEVMARRGGRYPGKYIPEFHALVRELFTPEEAAVNNAIPRGYSTAAQIAAEMGRDEDGVRAILETMADKGLCTAGDMGETRFYGGARFVPGIFEFQFMRGTSTDRDKMLAGLIHDYKEAFDAGSGPPKVIFPVERVITVDRMIKSGNEIHTYDQVASYIDKYDPIAVSTCFCRHEAELLDENDRCDKPNDVCMQFGMGARFVIDRGMGRRVSKEEAMDVLKKSEEAGLVHCSINRQEIEFLCNCCSCHCMILKTALAQPKPSQALFSRFQPEFDPELCVACETCIERCPSEALTMGPEDYPVADMDRCFGCGVCATGCPSEAAAMIARPGAPVPPVDSKALKEALKAAQA